MMSNAKGIDYGPLTGLIGVWEGHKGTDTVPKPTGSGTNAYYETLTFSEVGNVTNAQRQTLAVLRYHQVVQHQDTDDVFHDEIGYWMWDEDSETAMHSLTIPRGVNVLAGGQAKTEGGKLTLEVNARDGDADWGIIQSPFMRDNARTTAFSHQLVLDGDSLFYTETTVLDIYGKVFDHTDTNTLKRWS